MVEARSLHVIVSSDHPSADEQVAEAIARVVSRYAVDLRPEIEVNVPHAESKVTYVHRQERSSCTLARGDTLRARCCGRRRHHPLAIAAERRGKLRYPVGDISAAKSDFL
jgi:hypothetical protein